MPFMNEFSRLLQIRWSDLDPNFHVRHSVYYDWGAFVRIEFLNEFGLTADVMMRLQFGPILFREECIFRREIKIGDKLEIKLQLLKSKKDFARWTIQHQLIKNGDTVAALLTVDGAWMSMVQRKLTTPPEEVHKVFSEMPKGENFEWLS
jgi:acyl-CoA thioester hydrolase